jgi:hypothetical protein
MASQAPIPLSQWLRRQQRRTWILGTVGACMILSLGIWRGRDAWAIERWAQQTHQVESVEANGVLHLTQGDQDTTVVLQGIDSLDSDARLWLADQCVGHTVRVGFDPRQPTDPNGRRAVYLYRDNGRMLNERLISNGLAEPGRQPHRLERWFERLARRANQ